jgi:hypothetical protein
VQGVSPALRGTCSLARRNDRRVGRNAATRIAAGSRPVHNEGFNDTRNQRLIASMGAHTRARPTSSPLKRCLLTRLLHCAIVAGNHSGSTLGIEVDKGGLRNCTL